MANLYGYNTSTARKLNDFDVSYGYNSQKELHSENKIKKQAAKTASRPKQKKGIGSVVAVVLAFAMAFSVVSGYVAINEANNEISALKDEYNNIVASNQAIQVKIDKAIDLKELQTVAGEKFGMIRPERYQMFYVDLEMGDFSENTAEAKKLQKEEKVKVTGVPGIITGALNIFN